MVLAPTNLQNKPKTIATPLPKSIPKAHRKSTLYFIVFGFKMNLKMRSAIVQESTRAALWGHMGPKGAQMEGTAPPGTQKGGPGRLWGTTFLTSGSSFGFLAISFTTSLRLSNYDRINVQWCKMKAEGEGGINERTNKRTIKRTIKRKNDHTKERTNDQTTEQTNRRMNKGTRERAQERSNGRTKELTNERRNKRTVDYPNRKQKK